MKVAIKNAKIQLYADYCNAHNVLYGIKGNNFRVLINVCNTLTGDNYYQRYEVKSFKHLKSLLGY